MLNNDCELIWGLIYNNDKFIPLATEALYVKA